MKKSPGFIPPNNRLRRMMLGAASGLVVAGAILVGAIWHYSKPSSRLIVVGTTYLYQSPHNESANKRLAQLELGERLRWDFVNYGDKVESYRVETASGQRGWVRSDEGVRFEEESSS